MNGAIKHIIRLATVGLLPFIVLLSSCQMMDQRDLCCYNVQLNYRYYRSGRNELTARVQTMKHFLFDADSVLVETFDVSGEAIKKLELVIPSGKYTMVTFTNIANPSSLSHFVVGESRMSELELYIDNLNTDGYQDNSERLFFAYRNFTVAKSGVKYYIVDCTHAHNILTINVRWRNGAPPISSKYTMELTKVPGKYQFPVKRWVTMGSTATKSDIPESTSALIVHALPEPMDRNVEHQIQGRFQSNGSLAGTFITYRYTNERIPTFCLYGESGPLMKEIDLTRFFQTMGWELTLNIEQEFDLTMTIDGDAVHVSATDIADWEEGGAIGGSF